MTLFDSRMHSWLSGAPRARNWGHRPALDGLRALAVWMVVAYHSKVEVVSAGFIGVDLFFVLSGFVVTNAILSDVDKTGSVSLCRFYTRRVRRLMPAAVMTVTAVCAAFLLVVPFLERLELVRDAQASLLYVANWHAIAQSNDYFAATENASPFLHFWSLAIEEQFYLLFPLVVVLMRTMQRRVRRFSVPLTLLPVLLTASLVAQIVVGGQGATSRAYYGTDTRLYQLLAGAILAYSLWNVKSVRVRRWLPATTALAALVGFVTLGTNAIEMSPSTRGIFATVASSGLILSLELNTDGTMARVFSRPTVVYFGAISYGIYLWHWPIILLVNRILDLSPVVLVVVAGTIASAIASLSLELVENPVRRSNRLTKWPSRVLLLGLMVPVLVAVTIVPTTLESQRRPMLRAANAANTQASANDGGEASNDEPVPPIDFAEVRAARVPTPRCEPGSLDSCLIHKGSGTNVVVIGDSHAQMYLPALEQIAVENDWILSANIVVGCPWQAGLQPRSDQTPERQSQCAGARAPWFNDDLAELDPDIVLLAGRSWTPPEFAELIRPASPELDAASAVEILASTSASTVDLIVRETSAEIIIIEPTPLAPSDPLVCLSAAADIDECAFSVAATPTPEDAALREIADAHDAISSVNLDSLVCPENPTCLPIVDGLPVWRDPHHLTVVFVADRTAALAAALLDTGVFALTAR